MLLPKLLHCDVALTVSGLGPLGFSDLSCVPVPTQGSEVCREVVLEPEESLCSVLFHITSKSLESRAVRDPMSPLIPPYTKAALSI